MYQRDYPHDREWADSYESQVLGILSQLMPDLAVLYVASDETDMTQATDFEVKMKGGSIAVRLRDMKECRRWRDLTIRSRRVDKKTGREIKTELAKIKEGYGFRYFYGWVDDNGIISEWILVDLDKVREVGLLKLPREEKPNTDKKTFFIYIPVKELYESGCLIKYQGTLIEQQLKSVPRRVNKNPSSDDGIKRVPKCYNPRVPAKPIIQEALW